MELKHFTDSMFLPLMIQRECANDPATVAYNLHGIIDNGSWIEDSNCICYIPDLVKIELTFDGDINEDDFDPWKAEIFSIVATTPKHFIDDPSTELSHHQNSNTIKNIINCFSGAVIALPDELTIANELLSDAWSYRVVMDQKIYPCVVDGNLFFECI